LRLAVPDGQHSIRQQLPADVCTVALQIGAWHALNGDRKNILPPDTSYISVMPNSSIFMYPGNDSQHAQASDRSGRM
jgi:hypothetical protein